MKFLKAFKLDSSELWDLGRWFEWFCFECSSYSRLKFSKFLEALGLDSNKASMLLNLLWCCLKCGCVGVSKCLRKTSIYRSLEVSERHVIESDSDICHNLIGGALRLFLQDTWHRLIGQNVLIFKVTHVNTRLNCLCHCLHVPMCGWHFACFLCFYSNDTSQISIGF